MQILVHDRYGRAMYEKDTLYLHYDNWDDFGYKTSFNARYVDKNGNEHFLGLVSIGKVDMEERRTFDLWKRKQV